MPVTLMYHDVVARDQAGSSGFSGPASALYKIPPEIFASHLNAVAAVPSAKVVLPGEALAVSRGGEVLLTFDDGGASAMAIADLVEAHGWRGIFLVTAGFIDTPTFLTGAQIRTLRRRGHVIGSHSFSHPARMLSCSKERLGQEWVRSRDRLEQILGEQVATGSVPGGYYSRAVAEAAADAGYDLLFNSEPSTAVRSVRGCRILGRYSIKRPMTPEHVAALVSKPPWTRLRHKLTWHAKSIVKAIGGDGYLAVRRTILRWVHPAEDATADSPSGTDDADYPGEGGESRPCVTVGGESLSDRPGRIEGLRPRPDGVGGVPRLGR
jgi:peptidoglycan/xylan/chitin deacetylase (PgdA/CDA1 family)